MWKEQRWVNSTCEKLFRSVLPSSISWPLHQWEVSITQCRQPPKPVIQPASMTSQPSPPLCVPPTQCQQRNLSKTRMLMSGLCLKLLIDRGLSPIEEIIKCLEWYAESLRVTDKSLTFSFLSYCFFSWISYWVVSCCLTPYIFFYISSPSCTLFCLSRMIFPSFHSYQLSLFCGLIITFYMKVYPDAAFI